MIKISFSKSEIEILMRQKMKRAKLKTPLGEIVEVHATTDSPESSYGIPVWVDDEGKSYCQVHLAEGYEVFDIVEDGEPEDEDAIWVNGVGMIERVKGEWKLTRPIATAAASILGRVKSEKKAKSSRENGKKGGRPPSRKKDKENDDDEKN